MITVKPSKYFWNKSYVAYLGNVVSGKVYSYLWTQNLGRCTAVPGHRAWEGVQLSLDIEPEL